jgi:adenylate cyclase
MLKDILPEISEIDDDEILSLRLAIGNYSTLIGAGISIAGGTLYYIFEAKAAGVLWIAFAAILITGRWLFKNQKLSFHGWVYWSTLPLLGASLISIPLLGGLNHSNAVIIWAFMAPMLNLTMLGVRESQNFFIAYFVSLIIAAMIPSQMVIQPFLPDSVERLLFFFNLGSSSIFLVVVFYFFINESDRFQKQANLLLLNVFPKEVATLLKKKHQVIATPYDNISVLFADLAGFTNLSAQMKPDEVAQLLNEVFTCFDQLIDKYGIEKIKTIGDCYMAAAGVPQPRPDHAEVLARAALDMRAYLETHKFCDRYLQCRIGINSGPVVAGVIGRKKFIYDIWGDTVNTASRMESHGAPNCIQISKATHDLIRDKFICAPKREIEVKDKGVMEVWYLLGSKMRGTSDFTNSTTSD